MSIVLYALGACLLAWGGYLMVAGESYAAIDIAASVIGWGAFTIGLGAIVAALNRLTKAVAAREAATEAPAKSPAKNAARSLGKPLVKKPADAADKSPDAAPETDEDGAPPVFAPDAIEPLAPVEPSVPQVAPVVRRAPAAIVSTKPEPALAQPATRDAPRSEPVGRGLRTGLRRSAAKPDEPVVETPPVAAARLGGGLGARKKADAQRSDPPATLRDAGRSGRARLPEATFEAQDEAKAPRLIMPSRAAPLVTLDAADLAPPQDAAEEKPAPDAAAPVEAATPEPVRIEPAAPPPVEDVPAAEPVAQEASGREPPVKESSEQQGSTEKERLQEPTPPEPTPSEPEPAAPDVVARPDVPEAPVAVAPEPVAEEASEPQPVSTEPARSSEPKVPDWLARARARRQARMRDADAPRADVGEPRFVSAPPAVEPEPAPDPGSAPEPEPEHSEPPHHEMENRELEFAEPEPEPEAASQRQLVSEGEHNGVMYRFFDDGSVEAQSPHGVRRFSSVDELRNAVASAKGPDYRDSDPEPTAAPEEADPLDAALAELEGRPSPELRLDPEDRIGAGRR